jgi:hypothetical protein
VGPLVDDDLSVWTGGPGPEALIALSGLNRGETASAAGMVAPIDYPTLGDKVGQIVGRTTEQNRRSPRVASAIQMQQVRYFLAVCEFHSFTRAARHCGISQPALTNAITALERELGGALLQRRPFVMLTARGRAIQPYMQRIAENAELAVQTARAFADDEGSQRSAASAPLKDRS